MNGVKLAARLLDNVPAKELKGMADEIKRQIGSGVVALVAVADGKASLVVGVTDDLTKRLNAVDLVKVGSAVLGGQGGGGRPDMAQAGGPDGAGIMAGEPRQRGRLDNATLPGNPAPVKTTRYVAADPPNLGRGVTTMPPRPGLGEGDGG